MTWVRPAVVQRRDTLGLMMAFPRRICVYGPSGSGNSTVARAIGARLSLPVVELDAIFHARPGWDDLSRDEFREAVSRVLAEHAGGWVIEGNYDAVRDLTLPRADTVAWLRLPWRVVYPRLVRRTLRRSFSGELLWGVQRERLSVQLFSPKNSMLWWGIRHWRPGIRATETALRTIDHSANVVTLRSDREVRSFLARLEREATAARSAAE
jgi:adenylate kinase family enzyme